MDDLNYHHLRYFWAAAREGGITRAARKLNVSQPSLSAQIRQLEDNLGDKLFARNGRTLVLTEMGRLAFRYADEIFGLGCELTDALKSRTGLTRQVRLVVGIADVLPKTVVRRLLEPAFHLGVPVRIVCHEDRTVEEFIAEMAVHAVDLVLADGPAPPSRVRVFDHRLGESGTTVFGAPALAASRRRGFPQSLVGAPFLLPGARSALHRALQQWLYAGGIHPEVIAEADDSALVAALGQDGKGFFVGPAVMEKEICRRHAVQVVGRIPEVRQEFYAISAERRLKHPAVLAICERARKDLFA